MNWLEKFTEMRLLARQSYDDEGLAHWLIPADMLTSVAQALGFPPIYPGVTKIMNLPVWEAPAVGVRKPDTVAVEIDHMKSGIRIQMLLDGTVRTIPKIVIGTEI